MIYPLWYLAGLVLLWAIVPAGLLIGGDLLRTRRRKLAVRHGQWFWAYVFLSVAMAWSTLFLFYPLLKATGQSLTNFSLSASESTRWVGLANYRELLTDPYWWEAVLVTLIFVGGTLPVSVLVSLFLAMQILKQPPRVQTFFKAALYLPGVISPVVGAAVLKWIFHSGDGFANALLAKLGLPMQNWFGDPHLAMPVLIGMTWLGASGVGVIVYAAALGNIPRTYYEVAELDGATRFLTFANVTWPLIKPTTIFVTVTSLIGGFQIFAPALLITGGGPLRTTWFVNYHIYRTFYYQNEFAMASAMAIVLMLLIVFVSVLSYRWLATDVEY
ncbi:MAG TPA: sugar ABC transporter permease [Tepidisphaeraceae bacterium]|nr:sugar ABC transporter permease [Tepidisphaeraceae bacterium]